MFMVSAQSLLPSAPGRPLQHRQPSRIVRDLDAAVRGGACGRIFARIADLGRPGALIRRRIALQAWLNFWPARLTGSRVVAQAAEVTVPRRYRSLRGVFC